MPTDALREDLRLRIIFQIPGPGLRSEMRVVAVAEWRAEPGSGRHHPGASLAI